MKTFYTEKEKGIIKKELLDKEANKVANDIMNGEPRLSVTQLRRFYGEFKSLEKKYHFHRNKIDVILPLVKMVKSKAAYAADQRKIPHSFRKFLDTYVDYIEDDKEFEAFMLFFEAVVGFCYGTGKLRK